jgi:hypothetical protein
MSDRRDILFCWQFQASHDLSGRLVNAGAGEVIARLDARASPGLVAVEPEGEADLDRCGIDGGFGPQFRNQPQNLLEHSGMPISAIWKGGMRRRRSLGLGLEATVHQHEQPFREARKIATMCLKSCVPRGIPDHAGGGTMRAQ